MASETSFFCGFFPLKMKGPSGAAPVAVHIPTLPGVRWNSIFDWRICLSSMCKWLSMDTLQSPRKSSIWDLKHLQYKAKYYVCLKGRPRSRMARFDKNMWQRKYLDSFKMNGQRDAFRSKGISLMLNHFCTREISHKKNLK